MKNYKNYLNIRLFSDEIKDDSISILIICVVWIAMVIIANPIGDFPLNDDWVYGLAVKSVLDTGYYQFPSPSSANVGPQVYWGALFCLPFGFSFTALRFSSLASGLIGALVLYRLIRRFDVVIGHALLGALALAVNPLYFGLANSFMTDVPFVVIVLISLLFLVRGFQSNSGAYILIGLGVSFVAILIRQLGLVVLIGFAVAYPIKYGTTLKNIMRIFILILAGVTLHITYQYWLVHSGRTPLLMVHSDIERLAPSRSGIRAMLRVGANTLVYLGFFMAPFIVLFARFIPANFRAGNDKYLRYLLVAFALTFLGVIIWTGNMMPSMPNVLIKSGFGPLTLRDTYIQEINYPNLPSYLIIVWKCITLLGVMAGFLFVYFIIIAAHQMYAQLKRCKFCPEVPINLLFFVTGVTYFFILIAVGGSVPIFDRYLIIFIPLGILVVCNVRFEIPRRLGKGAPISVFLLIFLFLFSSVSTHDYLSWNRTRWIALQNLITYNKIDPNLIDGGYEFNGWFLYDSKYRSSKEKSWWWVAGNEYIVASGPIVGYSEIRRYGFKRWLLLAESNILVLRKGSHPQ